MRRAVFLDRDGTLIEQVHYLRRVEDVKLVPGAAGALRALARAGFLRVVVTNQAVVAKGLLTVEGLAQIHRAIDAALAAEGASVDAWYFCAEQRVSADRESVDHPDRKPAPGMLLRAARDLDIDLAQSFMVGDMISDTLAGRSAGCKTTILLCTGLATTADHEHHSVDYVARDISAAAKLILGDGDPGARALEEG